MFVGVVVDVVDPRNLPKRSHIVSVTAEIFLFKRGLKVRVVKKKQKV